MTIIKILKPVAMAAFLAATAAPALADQHHGGGGRAHGSAHVYSGYRAPVYRGYRPYYYRPYYTFRPHVSLGFGLWAGYPVPYPYSYAAPYPYSSPAQPYAVQPYATQPYASQPYPSQPYSSEPYGSPAPAPYANGQGYAVQSQRQMPATGGITFDITPADAAVLVDGTYVGKAGDFDPSTQPLGVSAGRHRIEIRAPGYRTMTFDAEIQTAQVIPYQGTLQRN